MQHLQPLLETIGFNHQESALYLHVLSAGELPASKIATATRIPRSTVRGILDALCTAGLMSKVYKRNTQYYSCKPPAHLLKYLEQKMNATKDAMASVKAALPLFDALQTGGGVVPKVQVFEGPEQVVEAFNHSLYTDGIEEILFVTSFRFMRDPVIKKNNTDFYIPRRIKISLLI